MSAPLAETGFITVALDDENSALILLDQTKLPGKVEYLRLTTRQQFIDAIKALKVRGAPAIGVAVAFALYLCAKSNPTTDVSAFLRALEDDLAHLAAARPTAVNLSWALARMHRAAFSNREKPVAALKAALLHEATSIYEEDIDVCRRIGEHALSLLRPGMGILTHCNAGALATVKYGTATAPLYLGQTQGYGFHIFCDETRPILQGARLTAFELLAAGMDVTLLCDGASASLMQTGNIQAVLVGCDRVAQNGDTANKIGTLAAAISAKRFGIPFYVCCPTSTLDLSVQTGENIVIEHRDAEEVTHLWYKEPMAPENVKVYNPAFDVTDASLITAIVTEKGIARPPYTSSLPALIQG